MNHDENFIKRCIELGDEATKRGDFPFGSAVVLDGKIISEAYNELLAKNQIYRHAEILALTEAQGKLSKEELARCVIYSNVEPCPMCAFAIQELNIRRVVFGLRSPIMGGFSKWKILQDEELNKTFPNTFGKTPEIMPDVLKSEVIEGWKRWDKEKWGRLLAKGVFK